MSFGSGSELGFGISIGIDAQTTGPARQVVNDLKSIDQAAAELSSNVGTSLASVESLTKGYEDTIQRSQTQMMAGMSLMAAGAATLAPIGFGVQMAGEFEKAEIGLNTLTKSTDKTAEIMANLKADAASTPFGFKDLLLGNTLLLSTGLSAEKAREDIKNLGNAVAATGGGTSELARMSVNLQQIRAVGKATSMDIKQFAMSGIDIYGLLADSTGKTVAEIKEMDISYEMLTESLKKASQEGGRFEGAMENLSNSIFGKFATLKDNVEFAFAEVGKAVMPILHQVVDVLTIAAQYVGAFIATPVGKYLVMFTAGVGILLTVMGALLFVTGAVRMASAQLSLTFLKMVPATIAEAFATGGLTGAMTALGASIWAAMLPMLPFVAGALAIAGAMYLLMSAIGVEGREWEKFSTLVSGVTEVFSTWNGETATLSRETRDSLKEMGILEFFQSLATWVIRIKEFGTGFFTPMMDAGSDLFAVFGPIGDLFTSFVNLLRTLGVDISSLGGDVSGFNVMGQIMGNVLYVGLLPLRLTVNLIGMMATAISWVIDKVSQAISWFQEWNASMESSGSWIGYMIDGIMFLVGGPISMLIAAFDTIIFLGESLADLFTFSGISEALGITTTSEGEISPVQSDVSKQSDQISQTMAETSAMKSKPGDPTVIDKTKPQPIIINNNTIVDGEIVSKTVTKHQQEEDSRNG